MSSHLYSRADGEPFPEQVRVAQADLLPQQVHDPAADQLREGAEPVQLQEVHLEVRRARGLHGRPQQDGREQPRLLEPQPRAPEAAQVEQRAVLERDLAAGERVGHVAQADQLHLPQPRLAEMVPVLERGLAPRR